MRWQRLENVQLGKVKVSQTGNVLWGRADNSVSIGHYRRSDAAPGCSACTRLSEKSPETQTETGREWGRDKERDREGRVGNMRETE